MSLDDEYKMTKRRITDELETDDTTVISKDVLLYGWDETASAKIKVYTTSAGIGVTI